MKSSWSNILFALFWAGSIIALMLYSSSLYDENWNLSQEVTALRDKSRSDSVEIELLRLRPDTVRITTTRSTSYIFEMQGKEYNLDEYLELFNRVYNENERRKDSLRVWKHNLEAYKSHSEDFKRLYEAQVDSSTKYLDDLYLYKTKYSNLQKYLKDGRILLMKGDTLKVIDDKAYVEKQ